MKYKTLLADPPWEMGKFWKGTDKRPGRVVKVGTPVPTPYPTMTVDAICKLNINPYLDDDCHLWLWTTNKRLHDAFHVMDAWGFKYLNTITYYKSAGVGAWFVNKTQHLLFGYRGKLKMGTGRYAPTIFQYRPIKHSKKPDSSYSLIESISFSPRLELFARQKMDGWDVWGNELDNDIDLE
jgi:N6-adenosine-specific RNA methylase IME4